MENWIQWVVNALIAFIGVISGWNLKKYNNKILQDKKTINKLDEYLPYKTIKFIHEHDFGGAYRIEHIQNIEIFLENAKNPEFFFLDKKLENLKIKLIKLLYEFVHLLAGNSNPTNDSYEIFKIRSINEWDKKSDWYLIVKQIHDYADKIYENYSQIKKISKKQV